MATPRLVVSSTLTRPANTTAYAAGDCVSAVTTNAHFTFAHPVAGTGWSGQIVSARLIQSANVATKLDSELWLFDEDITAVADNSAFAPTDAETLTCIGVIPFATASVLAAGAGSAFIQTNNIQLAFAASTRSIYGQLVARNAYVPTSSEVFTVHLVVNS